MASSQCVCHTWVIRGAHLESSLTANTRSTDNDINHSTSCQRRHGSQSNHYGTLQGSLGCAGCSCFFTSFLFSSCVSLRQGSLFRSKIFVLGYHSLGRDDSFVHCEWRQCLGSCLYARTSGSTVARFLQRRRVSSARHALKGTVVKDN